MTRSRRTTPRGRLVLALAAATYLAAWLFGSASLYPVAVGLAAAVLLAAVWVRLPRGPVALTRTTGRGEHVERDDLAVRLELELGGALAPGSVYVRERLRGLAAKQFRLTVRGGRARGSYVVEDVPRGRYAFEDAVVAFEDPFGLARTTLAVPGGEAVVVLPRLADVERLFSDAGRGVADGGAALLRRDSGFDIHRVREYERGESLRKVHWKTTARRGQLMVRELEDSLRDEVAVVLDAHAAAAAGSPPDSSFDMQVRAAGSILQAHVRAGRPAVLIATAAREEIRHVRSHERDWQAALELLATVTANGTAPVASLLERDHGVAHALELAVVTASVTPHLAERLLDRARRRRPASLVYVDAPTFAGRAPAHQPALIRLQAAGIPVAVVRRGDDLAAALGVRAVAAEAALG